MHAHQLEGTHTRNISMLLRKSLQQKSIHLNSTSKHRAIFRCLSWTRETEILVVSEQAWGYAAINLETSKSITDTGCRWETFRAEHPPWAFSLCGKSLQVHCTVKIPGGYSMTSWDASRENVISEKYTISAWSVRHRLHLLSWSMKCSSAALEDPSALLLHEKIILQKEQREKNRNFCLWNNLLLIWDKFWLPLE